jgi:hypothetical protein
LRKKKAQITTFTNLEIYEEVFNKKKILLLIIAGALLSVLSACGQEKEAVTTGTSIFNGTCNGLVNSRLDYLFWLFVNECW